MSNENTKLSEPLPNSLSSQNDLLHFLRLAKSQLGFQIGKLRTEGPYSERIAQMQLLEELLKEQVPDENIDRATRPAG